jgi:hypothetical protein
MLVAPAAWAGQVSVVDQRLAFVASPGESNVVVIAPRGLGYDVFDDGAPILAGDGCRQVDERRVHCEPMVLEIRADAGDGDDIVMGHRVIVRLNARGGAGTDLVVGGGGADVLQGDDGIDTVEGARGDDSADGGAGDDLLLGGPAADTLLGAEGADIVRGGTGSDENLQGGLGDDLMFGGEGQDILEGNAEDDVLIGGPEVDEVSTGTGHDLVFGTADEADAVSCIQETDQVRGRARWRGDRCREPPASTRRPRRWPPDRARVADAPPSKPEVNVRPVLRGQAFVTVVRVLTPFSDLGKLRIRVRLFTKSGKLLDGFKKRVGTRQTVRIKRPTPPRKAHRGRGKCCFG